jgi:dTDP-4-amino-4,6-dideoxygalactose transaminase
MIVQDIRIPYMNIAAQHAEIKAELLAAMAAVIDKGQFILGDEVGEFERRFAERCGVRYAVAFNSGTDALVLSLRVLGIGPGDEVITVPNSFVATASCIALVGARPVFVDVREDYNMDPAELERAITSKTKAILPVHLTGRPADMDPILKVARAHQLRVVEDCAQAVLAEYHGRSVGSFGDVGCFSLHPLKTLGACGDAGAATTNSEEMCRKLRLLRNHGLRSRDDCVMWGSNSRLDTLQAAILLVKMNYIETWTERRRSHAAYYQKRLETISGLQLPADRPHEKSVYHTFIIQAGRRDDLRSYLAEHGVETAVHYPIPLHLHQAAAALGYLAGSFPVAERQAGLILSLPIYSELAPDDLEYIVRTIRDFYEARP